MDTKLRLQADLKDNASPKIRQLGKELKEIRRTPGMEQAQKWMAGFEESAGSFTKATEGVAGVMGGLGVSGLAAAAGLSGLVEQFKSLGDHTFAMKRLGQQTKMTVDQIARWEYVGQVFRLPVEQIDAALHHYGDAMVDFMQRRGDIFGQLNQQDPAEADKLLGIKDPNARFREIIRWLDGVKDVAKRDRWATEFFGSADIDQVLTNGLPAFNKAVADAAQNAHTLTQEQQKQADDLQASIIAFEGAWNDLKLSAGSTVFSELKQAADDFRQAFQEVRDVLTWWQANKDKTVKSFVDDNAHAFHDEIKRRAERNAKERDAGRGPLIDIPGLVAGSPDHDVKVHQDFQEQRRNLNPLFHKSAFTTFDDGTSTSGSEALSDGVKDGVLAAFREWKAEQDAAATGGGRGGGGGFSNASFETSLGGAGADGGNDLKGFGKPQRGKWWTPDRQQHAVDRLMKEGGLSEAGAEGLVSRWANVEAGGGPTSQNPSSGAVGIAQWLGSRKHGFTADFDSQITHAIEEGKTTEARAWAKLREARSARDGAIGASMFERAEHYNGLTGIDSWTGKSLAGAARVHDEVEAARRGLPSLTDEARKAAGSDGDNGRVDTHIHLHQDGRVRGVTSRSSGIANQPQINIRRGPTMTQPDITA